MNEHRYRFIEPGRDRRDRQQQLKQLLKDPPGPDRAACLALLAREFHTNREINAALDTARLALQDAGGDVAVLTAAYASHDRPDLLIDDLAMLASLGRWLQHPPVTDAAEALAYDRALSWCALADGRERERRLDTLRRRFEGDLADRVDLALL